VKIAVDNQVSKQAVRQLSKHHEVVLVANDSQDEVWVDHALDLGAEVFVSPDLDIPNYLDRVQSDAAWVDLPQGLRTEDQFSFLMKQIERLVKK